MEKNYYTAEKFRYLSDKKLIPDTIIRQCISMIQKGTYQSYQVQASIQMKSLNIIMSNNDELL